MEKERVMKHAAPVIDFQERMFDFIEESFRDDAELLTKQETEQFWERLHQKQEKEREQTAFMDTEVLEKLEEPVVIEESSQIAEEKILIDQSSVISKFLNISISILFMAIMSINIVWMQYLSMRYGSRPLIFAVKWIMILMLACYVMNLLKPYSWVFWKKQAHD